MVSTMKEKDRIRRRQSHRVQPATMAETHSLHRL